MAIGDKTFTTELVRAVETRTNQGLGNYARVNRYVGTVASADSVTNTASVTLLGNSSASDGFKIRWGCLPRVGDQVSVSISDQERWIESLLNGNIVPKFTIASEGKMYWGPGNASYDTNLYRSAADTLQTDDFLIVGAGQADGAGTFGIKGSGRTADYTVVFWNDTNGGVMQFGDGTGSGTRDVKLYRSAANTLKTDDDFRAVGTIISESYLQAETGNLYLNAGHVNVYRNSAWQRVHELLEVVSVDMGGGSSVTLTTSPQASGLTLTRTAIANNERWVVSGDADLRCSVSGTTSMWVVIYVDGSQVGSWFGIPSVNGVMGVISTFTQAFEVTAGSHTVTIYTYKAGTGTAVMNTYSHMTLWRYLWD